MGIVFMPADEVVVDNFKLLIHGRSGVGKTRLISMIPDVYVLLTEANGVPTIRATAAELRAAGLAPPKLPTIQILDAGGNPTGRVRHHVETMNEVREVIRAAASGELRKLGCSNLGFDGLTEIQKLMKDEILRRKRAELAEDERVKPEEIPLEDILFEIGDWGELTDRMRRLLVWLRNVDLGIAATALTDVVKDKESGARKGLEPSFQGSKLPDEVMQYFSAAAYIYKSLRRGPGGKDLVEHWAQFDAPASILCKPCGALRGTQPTGDVRRWFREKTFLRPASSVETTSAPAEIPEDTKAAALAEGDKKSSTSSPSATEPKEAARAVRRGGRRVPTSPPESSVGGSDAKQE
jgi:hypothetical protein